MVVAGEAPPQAIAELAEIARKEVGYTVRVPTDTTMGSYPQEVLARGTAEWAASIGRAYKSTSCGQVSRFLTKDEYERALREREEEVKRRAEACRRVPELDSPEVWAKRKPRLLTAAGEGSA
jgi:hypothetical protein